MKWTGSVSEYKLSTAFNGPFSIRVFFLFTFQVDVKFRFRSESASCWLFCRQPWLKYDLAIVVHWIIIWKYIIHKPVFIGTGLKGVSDSELLVILNVGCGFAHALGLRVGKQINEMANFVLLKCRELQIESTRYFVDVNLIHESLRIHQFIDSMSFNKYLFN